ncbi:MAG: hypothetical protein ACI4IM_03280 [Acutalibacteraceae bacterium]
MTSVQKAIKYLAMAVAIILSVSIIGGIFSALSSVSFIFSKGEKDAVGEMQTYQINGEISSLDIEINAAKLEIVQGEQFSVESNHKYISVSSDSGKLRINETRRIASLSSEAAVIRLTVPSGFVFDEADIETGAGKVTIDSLSADILDVSLGAGKATVENLVANSRADIEGGTGMLTVNGGSLNNLNLDMGVGSLTFKSRIEGNSSLDLGVGEAKLIILGRREDYCIELDKGLGEARLEGESMRDDSVYGAGSNRLSIDGGVGAVNIEFSEETVKSF